MEEKVIRELKGHSGSKVLLIQKNEVPIVRKIGNVGRNYERLTSLINEGYPVPFIYGKDGETLDMEYIHGLDMKSYLLSGSINMLSDFIISNLNKFAAKSVVKDYTEVYNSKLEFV